MGLIDFVKQAGQKIFGGESDEEKKGKLTKHVQSMNLPVENLGIAIDGETVTLTGLTDSVKNAEKIALALGNVEGVSKVNNKMRIKIKETPTPEKAEPAEKEATFYTVQKGDSLSKISQTQYDDPMKYKTIFEANQPMLKDPDEIYPGQVLRIPPEA